MYRTLTANLGRARRVSWNGRQYLVAPITSIVPGVLPGSQGPLFYPPDEIRRNTRDWDGIPITKYHPFDPTTGSNLSAKDNGVWQRQGLGTIRNSVYRGKLCHEAWFDEQLTQQKAPEVVNALLNGQPMEVSTGLYTSNEPAPNGSTFNGRPYTHIAREYQPDHMAILPDQVGACSIQDGCGLNVNANTGEHKQGCGCKSCESNKEEDITENKSMTLFEKMMNLLSFSANADMQQASQAASTPQGRHPQLGHFQGTHGAQATKAFDNAHAGVTPTGSQKTKDGRAVGDVKEEETDPLKKLVRSPAELMANMAETYNVACAILNATPEVSQVYNIDREIAYNRRWTQAAKDQLPESDFAGLSQTFPIANQQDVDDALHLSGRADNPDAVRNKIVAIANRKRLVVNAFPPQQGAQPQQFTPPGTPPSNAPSIDSAHSNSKQAATASLSSEHDKAFGHAQEAVQASRQGDSETAMGLHGKAAGAHEKEATKAFASGDQSLGDNHLQAAALHRKAAAMHSAVNNARDDMGRFFTTNMPAGAAFQGAKDADFSPAQAAAMAGKLEGSYEGERGGSGNPSSEARSASSEAKRTGSAGAHKKAASAHREAASFHEQEGRDQEAGTHTAQAKVHDRAAKKAANNARILQLAINGGHLNSAVADQMLFALNTSDETGSGTFDSSVQVGGEEDDPDADDSTPGQKVKVKGKGKQTDNQFSSATLNSLSLQMFGIPLDEARSLLNNSHREVQSEKMQLIHNMTAHLDGQQRMLMMNNLRKFDLDDLQHMASLNPMMVGNAGFEPPLNLPVGQQATVPTFLGAGVVVPTVNGQVDNASNNDRLDLPTMNMATQPASRNGKAHKDDDTL